MLLQPLFDGFTMINTKIIKNQKNLSVRILDQASHELDQELGVHGILVHHEPYLPLVGNSGKHTYTALLGNQPDDRGLPLGSTNPRTLFAPV